MFLSKSASALPPDLVARRDPASTLVIMLASAAALRRSAGSAGALLRRAGVRRVASGPSSPADVQSLQRWGARLARAARTSAQRYCGCVDATFASCASSGHVGLGMLGTRAAHELRRSRAPAFLPPVQTFFCSCHPSTFTLGTHNS